jgi:hypothetical protein
MEHKPNFKDQEIVKVDMSRLGSDGGVVNGKIVGKSVVHVIDFWLIEFASHFPSYPYKVLAVPHTAIINEKEDANHNH